MFTVIFTPAARLELRNMLIESERDWGRARAVKTRSQAQTAIDQIAEFPFGPRDRGEGVRARRIGDTPFLMFYIANRATKSATVIAVIHGARIG